MTDAASPDEYPSYIPQTFKKGIGFPSICLIRKVQVSEELALE